MIIEVKVKTNAHEEKIEERDDGSYKVWVKAVPEKGRANRELKKVLGEHFNVAPSTIKIVGGATSTRKRIHLIK